MIAECGSNYNQYCKPATQSMDGVDSISVSTSSAKDITDGTQTGSEDKSGNAIPGDIIVAEINELQKLIDLQAYIIHVK